MNAGEKINQKVVLLFGLLGLFMLVPFVTLTIWSRAISAEKKELLDHLDQISVLSSDLKYSLIFAIETLYKLTPIYLIPEDDTKRGDEFYNNESYKVFRESSSIVEVPMPSIFTEYTNLYKNIVYKNACTSIATLDTDTCRSNSFITTGIYTSSTQILTRSHDASKQQIYIDSSALITADIKRQEAMSQIRNILMDESIGSAS